MKVEGISNIMQRLEIAHMIATLFQNAEKAARVISSDTTQRTINEGTQKPSEVDKVSVIGDEKESKKRRHKSTKNSESKDIGGLDILA